MPMSRSGQSQESVKLPAMPSQVRILAIGTTKNFFLTTYLKYIIINI